MISNKKRAALAVVTVGVWLAAAGTAAALAYDLRRPVHYSVAVAAPKAERYLSTTVRAYDVPTEIVIPTITITAPAPRQTRFRAAAPVPEAIDTSQMHCTNWRELQMGSGHVRLCR